MNHKSTRIFNQSWSNNHHVAQNPSRVSEDGKPVKVTVVNKMPEKTEEKKSEDPVKELKAEAMRSVLGSTDLMGGLIMLGLAGLAIALFKIPGGGGD